MYDSGIIGINQKVWLGGQKLLLVEIDVCYMFEDWWDNQR